MFLLTIISFLTISKHSSSSAEPAGLRSVRADHNADLRVKEGEEEAERETTSGKSQEDERRERLSR